MIERTEIIKCNTCKKELGIHEVYFHGFFGLYEKGGEVHLCKTCSQSTNQFIHRDCTPQSEQNEHESDEEWES